MHHGRRNAGIGICSAVRNYGSGVGVMGHAEIVMNQVKSITLIRRFKSNGNSRRIRIEMGDGQTLDIQLYGNTGKLEMLPKHKEFTDYDQL